MMFCLEKKLNGFKKCFMNTDDDVYILGYYKQS